MTQSAYREAIAEYIRANAKPPDKFSHQPRLYRLAVRLAKGEPPGATGQPRPAASAVTREGIGRLAQKAADAMTQLRSDFPAQPDLARAARHPYYGELNAFGWLLTLPNHYTAHLAALERGTKSAL